MAANYRYIDFELERAKHVALKSTPDLPFLPDRRLFFVQILAHRAFRRAATVSFRLISSGQVLAPGNARNYQ